MYLSNCLIAFISISVLIFSMSVVDENNHILVERDVNYVAGSVKCISCGTNYNSRGRGSGGGGESPERWQKFTNNRLQNQNRNYHSSVVTGITASTSTSTSAPCGIDKQIDVIEIHNGITPEQLLSIDQLHGLSVADYSRREAEAYLAVTRRQGGLKPLNRHFQPMQIKSNPNMNPGTSNHCISYYFLYYSFFRSFYLLSFRFNFSIIFLAL